MAPKHWSIKDALLNIATLGGHATQGGAGAAWKDQALALAHGLDPLSRSGMANMLALALAHKVPGEGATGMGAGFVPRNGGDFPASKTWVNHEGLGKLTRPNPSPGFRNDPPRPSPGPGTPYKGLSGSNYRASSGGAGASRDAIITAIMGTAEHRPYNIHNMLEGHIVNPDHVSHGGHARLDIGYPNPSGFVKNDVSQALGNVRRANRNPDDMSALLALLGRPYPTSRSWRG